MILYSSKFLKVNYLELQFLIHFYWTDFAGYMDNEGVYHELLNFLDKRIYKRGQQIFIDWTKIEHLVSQETIDWFFKYILPKITSHKAYRLGFLFSNKKEYEIPQHLPVNNTSIETKIFTNSEKLMQWLMDGAERKKPGVHHHEHKNNDSCHTNK